MTIGIPRSLFYYLEDITEYFLEKLDVKVIVSPKTNKHIIDEGSKWANDEMCLSITLPRCTVSSPQTAGRH